MQKERLIKRVRERRRALGKVGRLVKSYDFLDAIEVCSASIDFNLAEDGLLIRTKNYENMLRVLKLLRDSTGSPMPLGVAWYSCGQMLFSWKSENIELWLECDPNNVPEELLPSKDCEVKKMDDKVEECYAIVCPVPEGNDG